MMPVDEPTLWSDMEAREEEEEEDVMIDRLMIEMYEYELSTDVWRKTTIKKRGERTGTEQ